MPTKSDELKPCPFCGSEAKLDENANGLGYPLFYLVYCPNCAAVCRMYEEKDAAIRAWNRRINDEVNKLKPCPFCGAIPTIQKSDFCWQLSAEHEKGCFIRHMNGMNGNGKMSAYSKDVLIETWNRRANNEKS